MIIARLKPVLSGIALAALLFGAAQAGTQVQLRTSVEVAGEVVRLGDLFDGVVEDADVARAPEAGRKLVLDAQQLAALAKKHALEWQPLSSFDTAVVTRASQEIGTGAIKDALLEAMARDGEPGVLTGETDIEFKTAGLEIPANAPATVGVEDLSVDRQKGIFSATIVAPAEGAAAAQTKVSGRLFSIVEIPVARQRVEAGEQLKSENLDWLPMRENELAAGAVRDLEQLVGKAPRRALRPGQPIREADLQDAVTIKKGSLVTVVLQTAQMHLTVQAKALESGAEGEVIRVVNAKSSRTINATVLDENTVAVSVDGAVPN